MVDLSRRALRDDESISAWNREVRRQLGEAEYNNQLGAPLTEMEREPYRLLWEEDPQWQRYKRFYDEVYGEPQKTDRHERTQPTEE